MNNKLAKHVLILLLIGLCNWSFAQKQSPEDYITKWKSAAITQMNLHQIPASITLAQGILESGSGNSKLATIAKNHFGIKCHSTWTGETFYQDDDEKDECFRKYKDASDSYRDHSLFLKKKRYAGLFELKITDYKGWAKGLKKAGYATNPKYPKLLISLIERYDLTQYDTEELLVSNKKVEKSKKKEEAKEEIKSSPVVETINYSIKHEVKKTENSVPYIIIKTGDSYEKIEKELGIRKWQVTKYNELQKSHELTAGERIYIKPKRCKAKEEIHFVKKGETMRDISQLYGVKLKNLNKRNLLEEGSIPKEGEKIYLRKKKK